MLTVKTRAITSDSMDHLNPRITDYRDLSWQNKEQRNIFLPPRIQDSEHTWKILQDEFSISRRQAWENVAIYLYEHAQQILDENQRARCAPGFPCKYGFMFALVLLQYDGCIQCPTFTSRTKSRLCLFQVAMKLILSINEWGVILNG